MHHLNENEVWEVSEWKGMATGYCTFLEDTDLPFNFRHVLVCSCKLCMYAHCGEFMTHGDELSTHQSRGNIEATLGVKVQHRLGGLDKLRELLTWDGFHSDKLDVTADGCIERDAIYKKDVSGEGDVLVRVENGWWNVQIVSDNWLGFGPSSLAFQSCNDGAVDGVGSVHVIRGYRAVKNNVILDKTFKVFVGRKTDLGVQFASSSGIRNLAGRITGFVFVHGLHEGDLLF